VRTEAITVMIDFVESKTFNAASVGALTMAVSHNSDMSTWAAIGLALLVVGTFLLIFRKAHIELPKHPTAEAPLADDGQSRILSRIEILTSSFRTVCGIRAKNSYSPGTSHAVSS
jgi:hypothetical protein